MLATATIVFREVLEIALVLGIILAATRGFSGQKKIALSGLGLGLAGSVIIAFFTESISAAMDGMGQEIFNACVMFVAVGFLGWTVVWMKRHARHLSQHLRKVSAQVVEGERAPYVLVIIIALATWREGTEVVLFTYGLMAAGQATLSSVVTGGLLGLVCGSIIGAMLYYGLLKAARKHMFSVTSWMLIFLTAGMAAQGAGYLIAADIIPAINPQLWDTSQWLSTQSFIGETLSVLIGYSDRPTGMEVLVYLCVLSLIGALYYLAGKTPPRYQQPANI